MTMRRRMSATSPAKRHTPTLHDPLLLLRTPELQIVLSKRYGASGCDSSVLAKCRILLKTCFYPPVNLCHSRTCLNR